MGILYQPSVVIFYGDIYWDILLYHWYDIIWYNIIYILGLHFFCLWDWWSHWLLHQIHRKRLAWDHPLVVPGSWEIWELIWCCFVHFFQISWSQNLIETEKETAGCWILSLLRIWNWPLNVGSWLFFFFAKPNMNLCFGILCPISDRVHDQVCQVFSLAFLVGMKWLG